MEEKVNTGLGGTRSMTIVMKKISLTILAALAGIYTEGGGTGGSLSPGGGVPFFTWISVV